MIERLIENWLINTDERGLQAAFCQLLTLEGHRVLYSSSHGLMEQGKDIISLNRIGRPNAYQLKVGDINFSRWNGEIRNEVKDLVELPIDHTAKYTSRRHEAYLVTTGKISDKVLLDIKALNRSFRQRKLPILYTIEKEELLQRFINLHGQFLPTTPQDFRIFLELILADGRDPFPKEKFAKLLESLLFATGNSKRRLDYVRAIASAAVIGSYVLKPCRDRENHAALFEGWTMLGAYTLGLAEKYKLPKIIWEQSFNLIWQLSKESLGELVREIKERPFYDEGFPFTDFLAYHERMTLLLGYSAGFEIITKMDNPNRQTDITILKLLETNDNDFSLWGEAALPLILCMAWFAELFGLSKFAEGLLTKTLNTVLELNKPNAKKGLPSPYYSAEEFIAAKLGHGNDNLVDEVFASKSYGLKPLVTLLARRNLRRYLSILWREISWISTIEFIPKHKWMNYLWRSTEGEHIERFLPQTQSWRKLRNASDTIDIKNIPMELQKRPSFLLLFILVYPHRTRTDIVKYLDKHIEDIN